MAFTLNRDMFGAMVAVCMCWVDRKDVCLSPVGMRLCRVVCLQQVNRSDIPVGFNVGREAAAASELEMRWHSGQRNWRKRACSPPCTPETVVLSHELHRDLLATGDLITCNSMLATKLSRAQLELQAHRLWLRSFSLGGNARSPFSTTAAQRDARPAEPKIVRMSGGGYSGKRTGKPKSQKPFAQRKKDDEYSKIAALQTRIIEASKEGDFDAAMEAYRAIENKKIDLEHAMMCLSQNMSYWTRIQQTIHESKLESEKSEKVQQYAEELVKDVMRGVTWPMPGVSAHVLDLLVAAQTWDTATKFWTWLRNQGDEHVSAEVYASAISLLAAQDAKLEDLEALYQEGMARLPVGFAAYHFSPGAIVPDREGKAPAIRPPTALLQAIMAARLMRGDAQNAYLVLDAISRLRPVAIESRFYTEFQKERPVAEAYTVFALACKAGTVLPSNAYRALLSSLRTNVDTREMRKYVLTVRAMISATFMYIGAGGKLNKNSLTEIIIVLSSMLRVQGVYSMTTENKLRVVEVAQELISKIVEVAARFSVGPTIAAYNSIITNLAAVGNAESIIIAAIKEARVQGLDPTIVTRRSIIVAAGKSGDKDLTERAWKWLVDSRAREGQLPDATDLHILTRASVQTGNASFAKNVVTSMTHLEDWQRENLLERIDKETDAVARTIRPADLNELLEEVAKIKADLDLFDERTSDARGVQDFSKQVLPMLVFSPAHDVRLPEGEMRELYDQLTTDPSAPQDPASLSNEVAIARGTKVTFGQLRYENWKFITYLLAEADRHDKAYIQAVDAAITKGERPPQRNYGELFEDGVEIAGVGLSDPVQLFEVSDQEMDVEKARARICELRKVDVPPRIVQGEV